MKCLILAAGRGSRLSEQGVPKPLLRLVGLSLIERTILTAQQAGLGDFHVVAGYEAERLKEFLSELAQRRDLKITVIQNDEWECKGNGHSVLKARGVLEDNFVLLMADHIFEQASLIDLMKEDLGDCEVLLGADFNIGQNKLVDSQDVTKVSVKDQLILDIGKNIEGFDAYDTGMFLCSAAFFDALEQSCRDGDSSLSGGVRILARQGQAKVFDIGDNYWIDVDDKEALQKAEHTLLATLKKNNDGPISRYFNRPLSIGISRYLVKTSITPNWISFVSFFLCCLGGVFFFLGGYLGLVLGGILAQLSSIIDGCDGEIARLKFQATEFGGWFDAVLDRYADAFLLLGLTFYVTSSNGDFLYLLIGFMAIIGTFMNSYTADKYDGLMRKRIEGKAHRFRIGRDVRIFIILLGCLVNQPFLTLVVLAVVTNTENIRRIVVLYKNGSDGLSAGRRKKRNITNE